MAKEKTKSKGTPVDEVTKGYCVKCKATRTMEDVVQVEASNGRPMRKGTCKKCGTKMNKFVK